MRRLALMGKLVLIVLVFMLTCISVCKAETLDYQTDEIFVPLTVENLVGKWRATPWVTWPTIFEFFEDGTLVCTTVIDGAYGNTDGVYTILNGQTIHCEYDSDYHDISLMPTDLIELSYDGHYLLVGNETYAPFYYDENGKSVYRCGNYEYYAYSEADGAYIVKYLGDAENVIVPMQLDNIKVCGLAAETFSEHDDLKTLIVGGFIHLSSDLLNHCPQVTVIGPYSRNISNAVAKAGVNFQPSIAGTVWKSTSSADAISFVDQTNVLISAGEGSNVTGTYEYYELWMGDTAYVSIITTVDGKTYTTKCTLYAKGDGNQYRDEPILYFSDLNSVFQLVNVYPLAMVPENMQ